jgi:hypothetical protein
MFEGCEHLATFTGTFFETGASVLLCEDHFVDFAAGTLEAITGIPVPLLITLPPDTFGEVIAADSLDDDLPPTTPVESSEVGTDDDPVADISRASIAEHLDERHADITDAEFHSAPTQ